MRLTEADRQVFAEQVQVSSEAIQRLQHDSTGEGTREFYRHVSMLNSIKARFEIAESSEKNLQELNNILSNLYK